MSSPEQLCGSFAARSQLLISESTCRSAPASCLGSRHVLVIFVRWCWEVGLGLPAAQVACWPWFLRPSPDRACLGDRPPPVPAAGGLPQHRCAAGKSSSWLGHLGSLRTKSRSGAAAGRGSRAPAACIRVTVGRRLHPFLRGEGWEWGRDGQRRSGARSCRGSRVSSGLRCVAQPLLPPGSEQVAEWQAGALARPVCALGCATCPVGASVSSAFCCLVLKGGAAHFLGGDTEAGSALMTALKRSSVAATAFLFLFLFLPDPTRESAFLKQKLSDWRPRCPFRDVTRSRCRRPAGSEVPVDSALLVPGFRLLQGPF